MAYQKPNPIMEIYDGIKELGPGIAIYVGIICTMLMAIAGICHLIG